MPNDFANYDNTNIESNLLVDQSSPGLLSPADKIRLDDIYNIITYTTTLTLSSTEWRNTGVDSSILNNSGTYIVEAMSDSHDTVGMYKTGFAGIMYWYAEPTNDTTLSEISSLHHAGQGNSDLTLFRLATKIYPQDENGQCNLQILLGGNITGEKTVTITFKFKLIIPEVRL